MKTIHIARDFSPTPGGRFMKDGPYSGQEFRKKFLEPAVDQEQEVTVTLDDVAGLPSSFLEEAFGGLYRRANARPAFIDRCVRVTTERPALRPYLLLIERYRTEAKERALKSTAG